MSISMSFRTTPCLHLVAACMHDEELHDLQRRGRGVESLAFVDLVLRPEILCDEPAPHLDRLLPSHFDTLLDVRLHVDPPLELHQFLVPGLPHLLWVELLAAPVVVELNRVLVPVLSPPCLVKVVLACHLQQHILIIVVFPRPLGPLG